MLPFAFWEGLGVGLLASGVGSAIVWLYLRQRPRGGAERHAADRPRPAPVAPAARLAAPAAAVVVGASAPAPTPPPVSTAWTAGPALAVSDVPAPPVPSNGGQLRISHRVLLHIGRQGRIGPDEVAPRALTQAGMVESLEVNQGALTGVLRRLVAAGVLDERREHVQGSDRRLKVYRLTDAGAELSREIRNRRPP